MRVTCGVFANVLVLGRLLVLKWLSKNHAEHQFWHTIRWIMYDFISAFCHNRVQYYMILDIFSIGRKFSSILTILVTTVWWHPSEVFQKMFDMIPLVFWHCWLGDRKDIRPVKETGCWFVGGDILTGVLHVFQLQLSPLTTSIILSSNKIQNEDILVPANPGPPGKIG